MSERPQPEPTALTAPFWQGGADGELRIQRCATCRRWQHPPQPMCPACHSTELVAEAASGRGVVTSFTVNRYRWTPGIEPPYVLAEVELVEQPGLCLLTAITGIEPDGDPAPVWIGQAVEVAFESAGATWIPVFHPTNAELAAGWCSGGPDVIASSETAGRRRGGMRPEDAAVISGVGSSAIGRRLGRDPLLLTADAALAAIADAGLEPGDVDGLATYPGAGGSTPGITGAGVEQLRTLLGLRTRWHAGGPELAGQLGSVINAVLAVAGGLAEHVLCFRSVWESSAQVEAGGRAQVVARATRPEVRWGQPYGAGYATYGALAMQRYLHESGSTREQFAQLAVVSRANAAGNPQAVYREPMTVDDYLAAQMISDPLCMYDCDVPVDGAIAVIVSRSDSPAIDRRRSVGFAAMSAASGFELCAETLWARTDLKPADVRLAEIYDGFTIYAVRWLEALGLIPRHETGAFIEGGHRIALDGELPISTGGGQLSAGRLHGYGALLEACVQLRGDGGARQVPGRPDVAAVTSGADAFTSALLLTR